MSKEKGMDVGMEWDKMCQVAQMIRDGKGKDCYGNSRRKKS